MTCRQQTLEKKAVIRIPILVPWQAVTTPHYIRCSQKCLNELGWVDLHRLSAFFLSHHLYFSRFPAKRVAQLQFDKTFIFESACGFVSCPPPSLKTWTFIQQGLLFTRPPSNHSVILPKAVWLRTSEVSEKEHYSFYDEKLKNFHTTYIRGLRFKKTRTCEKEVWRVTEEQTTFVSCKGN